MSYAYLTDKLAYSSGVDGKDVYLYERTEREVFVLVRAFAAMYKNVADKTSAKVTNSLVSFDKYFTVFYRVGKRIHSLTVSGTGCGLYKVIISTEFE